LKKENVSIEDIFRVLSDNKALVLFNTIAVSEGSEIQIKRMGITTKQYYSRLSRLTESGLITRKNGRYFLTLLGRIVYDIQVAACEVLKYYWKIKALESIQMSAPGCARLPAGEFSKLVDTLIDDPKVKKFVVKAITPVPDSQKYLVQQEQEGQNVHEIKVLTRVV
jgi:DNA-binding HxlR family transcriptional regulator